MIAFFAVFVHHVPSYDADHNCHHLPHGPTTSQVAYLRGSGGIEYDLHEVVDEPVPLPNARPAHAGDREVLNMLTASLFDNKDKMSEGMWLAVNNSLKRRYDEMVSP